MWAEMLIKWNIKSKIYNDLFKEKSRDVYFTSFIQKFSLCCQFYLFRKARLPSDDIACVIHKAASTKYKVDNIPDG